MNWKKFWQERGRQSNPFTQVGRLGGSIVQDETYIQSYAAFVAKQLALNSTDIVLDICCGNGMLTHALAKYCKAIIGVDFSASLIESAKAQYETEHIQFVCGDALAIEGIAFPQNAIYTPFTKATLCFSFQYFETMEQGAAVLQGMKNKVSNDIYLGEIPDKANFWVYYHSLRRWWDLAKQTLVNNNEMGKFWSESELDLLAYKMGMVGKKIELPAQFAYSHYRMDYLISRR